MAIGGEDWLQQQYEQGRQYSGSQTANPWRRDTDRFRAWDEGFRNVPFSLGVKPPSESPKPAPGRLFD
jgi:hypothetical protein